MRRRAAPRLPRTLLLLAWILAAPADAAAQPLPRPSAADAREILRTPLDTSIGRVEALRVRRFAVLNGLLQHCGMGWDTHFALLMGYHRIIAGRSPQDLVRIAVWYAAWHEAATRIIAAFRPTCDNDLRRAAREWANALGNGVTMEDSAPAQAQSGASSQSEPQPQIR
ncbi:hypothetical protein GCM10010964_06480 [Caldovatus sediminis]|jgi:hypothetical protein|uniref:Secreted protein n=1 Tax=Caldovatus sediminis TaxID=2041189 RepID=A0A8J2Z8W5_9PROT|nr:hypothetical protein [Caldovatus sediminis]GGG20971.1 hypothetical protein GCM10010964_06480 [Caldovatus sediminis]